MKLNGPILILLFLFSAAHMQAQAILNWTGNYGGTKSETIRVVQPAANGNLWIGANSASKDTQVNGHSSGGENADAWIYQIDTAGNFLFAADCFGGSNTEDMHEIIVNEDGSLLLVVETLSSNEEITTNHGNYDAWIIKTDSSGNVLWQKCYGGDEADAARAALRAIENDGFVFAGYAGSSLNGDITNYNPGFYADAWFWKMDEDSTILWQSYFGGTNFEWATSLAVTSDGSYISACSSGSTDEDVVDHHGAEGISDIWILKLDPAGNLLWSKSVGGSANDFASGLIATSDGGALISGYSYSADGDAADHHGSITESDMFIIKIDADGNIEWTRSIGGSNSETGSGLLEKEDGYLITGNSFSSDGDITENAGDADLLLVKLDFEGNLIWQQTYGGSKFDSGRQIFRIEDKYYVGGGAYSSDGDITAHIGGIDNNKNDCWLLNLSICDINTISSFTAETDLLQAAFTNSSIYADAFYWDFGDGTFSTETNPFHEYASDGDYLVCLIAYGHCENDTICQLVSVSDCNIETIAGFAMDPNYLLISFWSTSLNADSVLWDFGDGTTSTVLEPDHNFPATGIYHVCLYAYGPCTNDTICMDIEVQGCDLITVPEFSFTTSGLEASFTDLSVNATLLGWDFGDGTGSFEINPVHIYAAGGTYTVCQNTSGPCNRDTLCKEVFVQDPILIDDLAHNSTQIIPLGNGVYQIIQSPDCIFTAINLSNIAGQLYPDQITSKNPLLLDISNLPEGIYILSLSSSNSKTVFKLFR